jgi:hypothetical protein
MTNAKNARHLEVVPVMADSGRKQTQGDAFGKFAAAASSWLGSKWAFVGAIVVIAVWALTGPSSATPILGSWSSIRAQPSSRS